MSISTVFASTGCADSPIGTTSSSALAIVPSGQSVPPEQLAMLNTRLASEVDFYKKLAIGGFVLAGSVATFAVIQRALQNQKLDLARAEGAAVGYVPGAPRQPVQPPFPPYGGVYGGYGPPYTPYGR